jgi:hypothetical protein
MRNGFTPPKSLKKLEDVLREEWYKIPLETAQNLCESIPRMTAIVLKAKGGPTFIDKEMCTVSVVFPLFCPTPMSLWELPTATDNTRSYSNG